MDTELVIKVKHGDTLRRFGVLLKGNGSLDLDMAELKAKIFNLFKFTPDVDLTLTYVDEDDDVVTLVDEADLYDAVKQCISPLRITVVLSPNSAGDSGRSGSSTPMRSYHTTPIRPIYPSMAPAQFRRPFPFTPMASPPYPHPSPFNPMVPTPPFGTQLSQGLAPKASASIEVVPGQEQSLSKLVLDLTSKVASAAPEQYRDFISKLSHDVVSKATAAAPVPLMFELIETLSKYISLQDPVSKEQDGALSKKPNDHLEESDCCKFGDSLKTCKDPVVTSGMSSNAKNASADNAGNLSTSLSTADPPIVDRGEVCNDSGVSPGSNFSPLVGCDCGNIPKKKFDNYPNDSQTDVRKIFLPSPSTAHPVHGLAIPPVSPQNIYSVHGQIGQTTSVSVPMGGFGITAPRKINEKYDDVGRVFHRGVRCDGCGVHPITGSRYKSKVEDDYDLCSICFGELGNDADYTRMAQPMCSRSIRLQKFQHPHVERPLLLQKHHLRKGGLISCSRPKLDSQFIEDVNIVDGTRMAPLAPFTKIWRMHNNGAVSWPLGTQLAWVGGDLLTNVESFRVELPVEGCPVGMELNVAINFTAPEKPGRYVSYWRLALPSGKKFGQCIWVLIQVDAPQGDARSESRRSFNLNFPPDGRDSVDQVIYMNVEPMDSNMDTELVKPKIDGCASNEMKHNSSFSIPPEVPAAGFSYPNIDDVVFPSEPTKVADLQTLPGEVSDGNTLEQSLLKELDEMGFKEIDLNKEILRVNEYDLHRSLDDLCGVLEWDPMLEELQDMGFHDKETNRKLLIKNGGSIKRVVMDLIASEKA